MRFRDAFPPPPGAAPDRRWHGVRSPSGGIASERRTADRPFGRWERGREREAAVRGLTAPWAAVPVRRAALLFPAAPYGEQRWEFRGLRPRCRSEAPTGRTAQRSQPSPRFFSVGYTRLEAAMRSSRLPAVKRLADFDFTFQPSLRREQIDSLPELDFLRREENVVFLDPPGVGKTHLAISLAIRVAERGRRVYYGSVRDLVGSLQEAETKGQLRRRLRVLTHPALLAVDEIGYLPVTRNGATLFFQLVNERLTAGGKTHTAQFSRWGLDRRSIPAEPPAMEPARPSSPGGGSAGDPSRLNRAASRRSSLRFGRNTPGPVLPVGAPPSRALSAGRLAPTGRTGRSRPSRGFHHRLLRAGVHGADCEPGVRGVGDDPRGRR